MNIAPCKSPAQEACRVIYVSEQPPVHCDPLKNYGDLLSISDLCEVTGLSAQTLRTACKQGCLPSIKIGRRYFIPKMRFIRLFQEGGIDENR